MRPLVSCAILRDVNFTQARYDSFIALQDKLHQNIARERTLVSIGTHDLNKIQGPFTYDALRPEEISFVPLNQKLTMNGRQLMEFYKVIHYLVLVVRANGVQKDKHLSRYLSIIEDCPVYPVIYDAAGTILSLPPIINGDHSKISPSTRDIFIEITAIDKTKLEIVNHMLVTMFSGYCERPYSVEPVEIQSAHNKESRQTPDLAYRELQVNIPYMNDCCGLQLAASEISTLLKRMAYAAKLSDTSPTLLDVSVPPTRADVLHQADVMEDLAIAYGFNRLPRNYPSSTATIASPLPINRLADIVRLEAAMAGWNEVLPLILCSHDENFSWLRRVDSGTDAVKLQNPKSAEYQVVRTSLLPGLLKTLRENKHHALPLKIFEAGDVVFKDATKERKARNERHFAAAWLGKSSGFEMVHGLLDRLLAMLKIRAALEEVPSGKSDPSYWITENEGIINSNIPKMTCQLTFSDPTFFAGHSASIHVSKDGAVHNIGLFGILHPEVLKSYDLQCVFILLALYHLHRRSYWSLA